MPRAGVKEDIKKWDKYESGEVFSLVNVIEQFGIKRPHARSILSDMLAKGFILEVGEKQYRKPIRHWMHTTLWNGEHTNEFNG